ncbi:glutamate receptor 2.7-like [Panicum miliaceum]|uniref:Glutamate receptor 2.7-like n=1 Tax=Panicum miliaceum TaxID=4540 RepID=A0A3L6STU7_PANMI|nr:glutamate receptor 2.7-like [Panicum miliaceum]
MFLITAVAASLVLVVYLATFVYRERHELRAAEPGSGSVSLKRVAAALRPQGHDGSTLQAAVLERLTVGRRRRVAAMGRREQSGKRLWRPGGVSSQRHSRMDSASPLERKGSGEFRTPFEQRIGEAQNTEERKKLLLSP